GLDALGQIDLLGGVEQSHLADLLEVVLDRVGGGAGGNDLLGRSVLLIGVGDDESACLCDGGVLLLLFGVLRLGRLGGALLGRQRVRCRFDFLGGVDVFDGLLRLGRLLRFLRRGRLRRGRLRRLRRSCLLRGRGLLRRSRRGLRSGRLRGRLGRLARRCLLGSGSARRLRSLLRSGLRRRG